MLRDKAAWISDTLKPNYRVTVSELYTLVFDVQFQKEQRLNMLELCNPSHGSRWRPTWVTDWATPKGDASLITRQYSDLGMLAVSGKRSCEILVVKGMRCARLSAVGRST